jgi:hypothetical protein
LLIPKIYLDADWEGKRVDVLAIDRAGNGDVHAVRIVDRNDDDLPSEEIKMMVGNSSQELGTITELKSLASQFKHLAIINSNPSIRMFELTLGILEHSLAADGVGRVGILSVNLGETEPNVQVIYKEESRVQVLLKAERFRSSREIVELADQFVTSHTANWEIRE